MVVVTRAVVGEPKMKQHEQITKIQVYTSEIVPAVSTTHEKLAQTIVWADAHPVAWKIVMGTRSAPFGKNACTYLGCSRGDSPAAVLDRVAHLQRYVEDDQQEFFCWRARFTMEYYGDKGFRGGFFQQFDGTYDRGAIHLDYTLETRDEVIDRFLAWSDLGYKFPTVAVKIDDVVVRVVETP